MKRYCPKCKKRKSTKEFSKDKHQNVEALAGWCRDCIGERVKKRRATQTSDGLCIEGRCVNKTELGRVRCAEHLLQNRLSALVLKGLLPEELDKVKAALATFNGICPICTNSIPRNKWHVDHDHTTGLFRAILCSLCNRLIGIARESVNTLKRAVSYIQGETMAYLNCPFCPSQAVHVETHTYTCQPVLFKFKCLGNSHEFFVEKEKINGSTKTDEGSTDRTGTCA